MAEMGGERARVAARWADMGYGCDLWVDPPGQVWANFVHPTDERVRVLEGELEIETGGATHRLRPGDECHIPARQAHTVRNVGGSVARWLYGYKGR